jgi:hypothetical protein
MRSVVSSPLALLTGAVRRFGRSPAIAPWLIAAYHAVCRGGARYLEGLEPARAVFVSGSLARGANVVPGVSDIDLIVIAELRTTEAELAFRDALSTRHRRLHTLVPVFHNLEYFEQEDVPYLAAFGNAWIELDSTWRLVAGTAPPAPRYQRPAGELRLARLCQALVTWRKSGCQLLDPRLDAPDWVLARTAERLLAVMLAAWLGRDRHEPFAHLLEAAARQGLLIDIAQRDRPRAWIDTCLASGLDALDRLADACTAGWTEPLAASAPHAFEAPSSSAEASARSLITAGFASAHLVPDTSPERGYRVLAVAAHADRPSEVVERAQRAFRELPAATSSDRFPLRPWVLTPRLWRAAALLEPSPWLAAGLASGAARRYGAEAAPVLTPPPAELRSLLALRSVELFYRARSRRFRIDKPDTLQRLAADLTLAAFLARAADSGEMTLFCQAIPHSEAAQIAALRAFAASRRRALEPELERRASGPAAS